MSFGCSSSLNETWRELLGSQTVATHGSARGNTSAQAFMRVLIRFTSRSQYIRGRGIFCQVNFSFATDRIVSMGRMGTFSKLSLYCADPRRNARVHTPYSARSLSWSRVAFRQLLALNLVSQSSLYTSARFRFSMASSISAVFL